MNSLERKTNTINTSNLEKMLVFFTIILLDLGTWS